MPLSLLYPRGTDMHVQYRDQSAFLRCFRLSDLEIGGVIGQGFYGAVTKVPLIQFHSHILLVYVRVIVGFILLCSLFLSLSSVCCSRFDTATRGRRW